MKLNKIASVLLSILLAGSISASACTSLSIQDTAGDVFHGRTLEYMEDIPSWLTYYPQGTRFHSSAPDGSAGLSYSSRYAILAVTMPMREKNSHDLVEGMNTGGLSFSENMIMGAELPALKQTQYHQAIAVTELGEWALASFSRVDEVKTAIEKGDFWSPKLALFDNMVSPFHYAFYDRSGKSIVVEVSHGKLKVYDNPTGVMTNGPVFPWHLTNLNNYTQLTNEDRSFGKIGNMSVMQPDSGIATAELPNSDTSVGRFVRGVFYTTFARKTQNSGQAINTLSHIMDRFDRTKDITTDVLGSEGEGNKNDKPITEYTVWTSLSDLTQGIMYIRGYNDINYTKYSLANYKDKQKPVFTEINLLKK